MKTSGKKQTKNQSLRRSFSDLIIQSAAPRNIRLYVDSLIGEARRIIEPILSRATSISSIDNIESSKTSNKKQKENDIDEGKIVIWLDDLVATNSDCLTQPIVGVKKETIHVPNFERVHDLSDFLQKTELMTNGNHPSRGRRQDALFETVTDEIYISAHRKCELQERRLLNRERERLRHLQMKEELAEQEKRQAAINRSMLDIPKRKTKRSANEIMKTIERSTRRRI